jgi:hypothetical protein
VWYYGIGRYAPVLLTTTFAVVFLYLKIMDELEYENYLAAIDRLDSRAFVWEREESVLEQLRDEDGYRVPGCFHTRPANIDG